MRGGLGRKARVTLRLAHRVAISEGNLRDAERFETMWGWVGGSNASACSSEAICYLNVMFIGSFRVERAERMANDKLDPPSLR